MLPTTLARIIFSILRSLIFGLWSLVFDLWSVFRPNQNSKTKVQRPKSYVVTCFSESTIPTIVQSVGVSSRLKGKLASFPRHQKTNSPTPAPTESIATMGFPCAARFLFSDWMISSFRPLSESFLTVATTVPMTRASCISLHYIHSIDHADNCRVHGRVLQALRQARAGRS